jgi:hypothetical protein
MVDSLIYNDIYSYSHELKRHDESCITDLVEGITLYIPRIIFMSTEKGHVYDMYRFIHSDHPAFWR